MSYFDESMYREIILDHVNNPRNKDKEHNEYTESTLKNPSCGDIVTIYLDIKNNIVEDITYNVSGCSICTSSTSMMSELLKGKKIDDALIIVSNFNKMIIGEEFDKEILGEAISLIGVSNMLPRIKCATLSYKAFLGAVNRGDVIE